MEWFVSFFSGLGLGLLIGLRLRKRLTKSLGLSCMNLEQITNTLREIEQNGITEVGLAAGADAVLNPDRKLRVLRNCHDPAKLIECALSYLETTSISDPIGKRIIVAAIYALFNYDLVRLDKLELDHVWVTSKGNVVNQIVPTVKEIMEALTLIIATKVNFYSTNHHTGQSIVTGYPAKVVKAIYENWDLSIATDTLHTIGHWASTPLMFRIFGLEHDESAVGTGKGYTVSISRDIALRLDSTPAGTAKLGLCYNIASRLRGHEILPYVPNIDVITNAIKAYHEVMGNRCRYHISSSVITGQPRLEYDDSVYDEPLAILGTFSAICFPNASFNKSPILCGPSGNRYKELNGYDSGFEKMCLTYMSSLRVDKETAKSIFKSVAKRDAKKVRDVYIRKLDNAHKGLSESDGDNNV